MSDAMRMDSSSGRIGNRRNSRRGAEREGRARGRLLRKYVLLIVGLVALVLLLNGALDLWFGYRENEAALFRIQQEKADAAAARIGEFVEEIDRQIGWTTHAQWATEPIEQRRFDYFRLMRQVPPITELIQLDGAGKEELRVSRLEIDVVGGGKDDSQSPAFVEAQKQRVWFGPVYLRKQSEPYMTLSMAQAGRDPGVTVAEVNLKLIWDVINALKVGKGGYAYVVDRQGRLIAHPDISLVLRDTNLSQFPQVAAALAAGSAVAPSATSGGGSTQTPSPTGGAGSPQTPSLTGGGGSGWGQAEPAVTIAKSIDGRSVLSAHAAIPALGWTVFVEVPTSEALAPLYGSAMRTAGLLLLALVLAALAALFLARRMTVPIRQLQAGAARIGAGELDRRIDIHTGDELEDLAGDFNRMAGDLQESYAGLEKKVEDRTAELKEALDQQTATAEVLGVINSSPGDLAPVFDAILEKATRLCGAVRGQLATYDGERFRFVAVHGGEGFVAEQYAQGATPPSVGVTWSRIVAGEPVVHIADVRDTDLYRSGHDGARRFVDRAGGRSLVTVALRKDDLLLGALTVYRLEVRPFSDKEIALLQNFAAQAVIAMENARLLTETREALEQQTATAEVLQVINSSPGDLAPVFDAILEKAHTLCGAAHGSLTLDEGEHCRAVATRGMPEAFARVLRQPFHPGFLGERLSSGEPFVQIADITATPTDGPVHRAAIGSGGVRTLLAVPLRKDGALLGYITANRQEVRPFSEKQIALLQNFAAQAVIAMENARLLTETREALEQQTATAEVLQIINSSPGDLTPVFDAILERATHLCEAAFGTMGLFENGHYRSVAVRGVPPAYAEFRRDVTATSADAAPLVSRLLAGEAVIHTLDLKSEHSYQHDLFRRAIVDLGGARSSLVVSLKRDDDLLGAINVYRQEVRPFTDKQIALLRNFSAQAVIAMENARLITETREALEQQTATTEVLQVINSSPGDLAPVFDAILEKAHALCGASSGGLVVFEDDKYKGVAVRGEPEFIEYWRQLGWIRVPGGNDNLLLQRLRRGELVHIADATVNDGSERSESYRRLVELSGARTLILVPLYKDDALLGAISAFRQENRPFTDKQIALLQNFAAQAVIAMENARLITETREALEQQTATAEVLQVINASPGDLAPVFDAMLEKAMRLCRIALGALELHENGKFRAVAIRGVWGPLAELLRQPFEPPPKSPLARLIAGEKAVQITDMFELARLRPDDPRAQAGAQYGLHTALFVPLRRDAELLGQVVAFRQELRPFSEKEIALLENFAAQAVIAMENARLLNELRQRTSDLQESLEYQTAISDVLKVISRSTFDLDAVMAAVVNSAIRLCRADHAGIYRNENGEYRWAGGYAPTSAYEEHERDLVILPGPGTVVGRAALEGHAVQIADAWTDPLYEAKDDAQEGGVHTMLGVPLLREGSPIGVIGLARNRVELFTEKQIALVTTFADQAVIAIENARLFNELRQRTSDLEESLEYQTATSDVLRIISQSGAQLDPVLQTLVETAARICDADKAVLQQLRDGLFRMGASFGFPQEFMDYRARNPIRLDRGTPIGRMALERQVVHVADAFEDPEFADPESRLLGEFRTMLAVPLFREDAVVGGLFLARSRVEPFTEKQIALVTTFADQAVIAIENARLLGELRERTAELGRSVEELKVLGEVGRAVSSTLDLRAVLSTVLTRSVGLSEADAGAVFRYSRAERLFRLVEAFGWDEALLRSVGDLRIAAAETAMGEAAAMRAPIQIADLAERPNAPLRDASLAVGFRGVLIVPLVGPERVFGALVLQRRATGEFPAETVRLMQTLASQSVLAIQNARLFREIADKSEQLALASEHKSQFLANMSHELRTPLNAILGYAELLVDGIYGVLPEKAQGVLERVQNNGKHLLALINDVLDLAKIEAGQLTLTLEDYNLPELVRTVVTATEPLAAAKGLTFTTSLQEGMPLGHGDARRLSQVLLNLVGNAIKFTDQGEVAINASAGNGQFVLTVRDTGPGIDDADQERIFGEFQQIENADTRKKGGTGLGLAISKRMVEMQVGMISVESAPGRGSTFRVVLPVQVEPALEEAAE